jgi:hypothetical protein
MTSGHLGIPARAFGLGDQAHDQVLEHLWFGGIGQ